MSSDGWIICSFTEQPVSIFPSTGYILLNFVLFLLWSDTESEWSRNISFAFLICLQNTTLGCLCALSERYVKREQNVIWCLFQCVKKEVTFVILSYLTVKQICSSSINNFGLSLCDNCFLALLFEKWGFSLYHWSEKTTFYLFSLS